MHPDGLQIKDTPYTPVSYLDFQMSIGRDGQLNTAIYDKLDDFHITKSLFLRSIIPFSLAFGVLMS